jgi:hypothetical protein
LLVDKATMSKMWVLRRVLLPMGVTDAMEFLLDKMKYAKTNAEFFDSMSNQGGGNNENGESSPSSRPKTTVVTRRASSSGSTNSNND